MLSSSSVFGHDALAVEHEVAEHVEDLRLDVERRPAAFEQEPVGVDDEVPEGARAPSAISRRSARVGTGNDDTAPVCRRPARTPAWRASHLLGRLDAEQVEAGRSTRAASAHSASRDSARLVRSAFSTGQFSKNVVNAVARS